MRLSELIARLDDGQLQELVSDIVPGASEIDPNLHAHRLEIVLANTGHVEATILARRPPVASVLLLALESESQTLALDDARDHIAAEVERWCEQVTSGGLAHRVSDRSDIYRRMLEAAWRNDLVLDPSEIRMLNLLRDELGLLRIEHFLLAHHASIQPFWRKGDPLELTLRELEHHGVLFGLEDSHWALPKELVPHVRRALGVSTSRDAARRLFRELDSRSHLKSALSDQDLPTSGSKTQRIERLVESFIPPGRVVDTMHIFETRELARKFGLHVSGPKEELIGRIVEYFASDRDLLVDEDQEEQSEPERETRELTEEVFTTLFMGLKGYELQRLLMALDLPHSGSKEVRIGNLWESTYSERTLLAKLKNPELSTLLRSHGQPVSGSKADKIERLISHLISNFEPVDASSEGPDSVARQDVEGEHIHRLAELLQSVELKSKSPTRFDPVRNELASSLDIAPQTVGVKFLGDPKNHRNRIGEALRNQPRVLLLLVPRDEGDTALEAARSRLGASPRTHFMTLLQNPEDSNWISGDVLCGLETSLLETMVQRFPDLEVHLVGLPAEAQGVQVRELVARVRAELATQWSRDDVTVDIRVRRALLHSFERADAMIRTKHVSDIRNLGNRVSEALGAGCDAIVLIVSAQLGEASRVELGRQLRGSRRALVGVVIAEREDGDYADPVIVHRELGDD